MPVGLVPSVTEPPRRRGSLSRDPTARCGSVRGVRRQAL